MALVLNGSGITSANIVDNAITSSKIADGTIVNDDINASANIPASKLSGVNQGKQLFIAGTNTATSLVSPNTNYKMTFNVDLYDPDSLWDTSASKFTCQEAGVYKFTVSSSARTNNSGDVYKVLLSHNGSLKNPFEQGMSDSNAQSNLVGSMVLTLAVNDYIEVYGKWSGGGSYRSANFHTDLCSVEGWKL